MSERPNLLYLHSDQHNPFVMGCAGDAIVETPNLDRLAARGVLCTEVYCPSPVCVASRMSMLCGRYPHEIEVWANSHVLDSAVPTQAHAMGAASYRPALAGRMHSIGPDQLHGYVERPIGDHSSQVPGSGNAPGSLRSSVERSGRGQSGYQVHDEDTAAVAVDWLNRYGVRRRAGQEIAPFSLSVGFMLPHSPYLARPADLERYRDRVTPPAVRLPIDDGLHPFDRWWREHAGLADVPEVWTMRARAAYWALTACLDTLIGQVLEALEANGLANNTLIVYSSDHGDMVGERELWMKRCFYEPSAKVPTIVSWPGVLPEGGRCERVLSSLDLNATMLAALQAPALPGSHGRDALALLRGEAVDWEDVALSEYALQEGFVQRMARQGEWKLIYHHNQPPQLFDVRQDPQELHDRAGDPDCRDLVEALTARIFADGWDPERITRRLREKRQDNDILRASLAQCPPAEPHRWNMEPGWTFSEDD